MVYYVARWWVYQGSPGILVCDLPIAPKSVLTGIFARVDGSCSCLRVVPNGISAWIGFEMVRFSAK